MNVSINVFIFSICSLLAFGWGLDEDLTEIKQMMGKLIEENAILRSEVGSIRGQYGEENAILRSEVESIREENGNLRSEVEAINLKLEGVQEGNNIL